MIKNIRLMYIHNFLTDVRFHGAFLVVYLSQIAGSYETAMAVLSAETVTSAVMDIPTGILSDKIGRKYTLAAGSSCMAIALTCYALATEANMLFFAAFFHGLGQCLFSGNNNALLYESLKNAKRESLYHHYQGRLSSMFQLALGLSALSSGLLANYGLKFLFILSIIPQILALFVSFLFKEPRTHIPTRRGHFDHLRAACSNIYRKPFLSFLIMGQAISFGSGEANFNFMLAFVNSLWPTWAVGIYKAACHAFGFSGFWLAGRVIDRVKPLFVMAISQAYWFISQIFAVITQNLLSPALLLSGSIFFGPFMVSHDKILQEEFSDDQRATMGSIASFAASVIFAIVAIGIGYTADKCGLAVGVGLGVATGVLSLPVFLGLLYRKP